MAKLAGLAALVVPLTTGCSVEDVLRFGWPSGVTPQAEAMRALWTYSSIVALVVGAITWGAMFWAITFHRKREGDDDDNPPPQTQYNLPVEIVFTVIPTIIVAVLFGFTVVVQNYVDIDMPDPDVRVEITASQWTWGFGYPDNPTGRAITTQGTSETVPILVLPTNQRIEFTQHSEDVIHSFFVPEFLFKRDVFPLPEVNDQDGKWQIDKIDREGAFVGRCAELCGSYHSQMNFEVRALSPERYRSWLDNRAQGMNAGEALAALNCGELCAPQATTTYPFDTERTKRAASERPAAGR